LFEDENEIIGGKRLRFLSSLIFVWKDFEHFFDCEESELQQLNLLSCQMQKRQMVHKASSSKNPVSAWDNYLQTGRQMLLDSTFGILEGRWRAANGYHTHLLEGFHPKIVAVGKNILLIVHSLMLSETDYLDQLLIHQHFPIKVFHTFCPQRGAHPPFDSSWPSLTTNPKCSNGLCFLKVVIFHIDLTNYNLRLHSQVADSNIDLDFCVFQLTGCGYRPPP
jgi:hypothetical protein